MAATWNVLAMDSVNTEGSLSDVIKTIHWELTDSETVGSGDSAVVHNGRLYGTVAIAAPDPADFTAYNSVTEADAISWAKAKLGSKATLSSVKDSATYEAQVAARIAESKAPTKKRAVPW